MPTPLTPDEEFDALFRRGLEHHPEQPENLAAWHRMDLLLDADLRQQALRRKVLRMLGAESVLLVLLLWGAWFFVTGHSPLAAGYRPTTARLEQPAGATHELALDKLNRQKEHILASAATHDTSLPESNSAARLALAATSTSRPAGVVSAHPVTITKSGPATQAAHNSTAGGQSASNGQLLATTDAMHRKTHGRPDAKKGYLAAPNKLATAKKQPEINSTLVASATTAAQRSGHALPLVAMRRPAEQLALRPQRGRNNIPSVNAAYSAASAVAEAGQSRAFATGRRSHQRPAAGNDGRVLAIAPGTQHNSNVVIGTAIDPLVLRWPTTDLYFALPDSLRLVALGAPTPSDSVPPLPPARPYRLWLGLVGAPELSTVRTNRLSPPGPSVGVQLDYRLARRWRLSTAFLYSVKRYGAAGTDYTVPYTMPHGWVINDVNAVCRIIDIPLNLRYDLWQRPRYQVFASAGLSSLLMKREQYTYDYAPVYGKPVPSYTFDVSNGSQHFLKVLNLSAGYERMLGQRWSVQAESFVKLPLAGVGYGAVRLRSAGVFFSLRYGLLPVRPAPVPGLR